MIELSVIWAMIVAFLPTLGAIIGIIVSVVKLLKDNKEAIQPIIDQFNALRAEVQDKTDIECAKEQMLAIMTENRQLRQEMADLITELRKQKYEIPNKEV